ncbi:MAG: hypothetical protein U1E99_07210 [Agitococcus sp.]
MQPSGIQYKFITLCYVALHTGYLADKAQPQQSTSEPVAAEQESAKTEEKPKFSRAETVFSDAFTVSQTEQERIANDIDRLANSLQSYPQPVQMTMPPVLLALDGVNGLSVKDLPLELDRFTLRKMTGQVDGKQDASHQLTLEQIKQLPNELANPIAVLQSDTTGGLVVITSMQDKSGSPVVSAIHLQKTKKRYVVNDIASAYGRSNFDDWIVKQVKNVVYINDKSPDLVRLLPTQLREMVHQNKASNQNILTPSDVVNKFETDGKFSQSSAVGDRTIT